MDKGESLGRYVARSLDIIDRSGIAYKLNPMGTVLEGDWDHCMDVMNQCFEAMRRDCDRITCSVKIDYRSGPDGRLDSKVAKIESILDRPMSQ